MRALRHNLARATLTALLLAAAGCGPELTTPGEATAPVTRGELDGLQFLLASSVGFEPLAGSTVRLSFRDGQLSAGAGCNHLGGAFQIRDGTLVVTELGMTEIGCDPEQHTEDEWLLEFLTSRPRITREGERLTLTGTSATLTFVDREVADPDQPLAGAAWTIDTFLRRGGASHLPSAKHPTLTFRMDGTLEVDTTCNTSRGNYTVSGDALTLSNVAYTEKACSSPASFVEEQVQAVIADGTLTIHIDARRLTIERGDIGLSALRTAQAASASGELTVAKLNGREYLLEQSEGFTLLAATKVHLGFRDGRLSFSGGCNGHSAAFELRDETVVVDGFSSTLIGCDAARSAQDRWLAMFFAARPTITQSGDRLIFKGADATLTFLDREVADPDQPLAGAKWTIDTYIRGDAAMSGRGPSSASAASITFGEDGSVRVFASCNSAQGSYTVQGDTIALADLAYTEEGCSVGASLEQHVQAVMADGSVKFAIEAGRLTITRGDLRVSARREVAP
jgi:heat shock protein HslJ